ncbi:MAG: response regulator transcription factor [Acidobacteria bacterium]|nr:response regulator transcription factor [Acidobacteriota bacterium]
MWILVVEDDVAMGRLLCQGLEAANHTVALATDGLQGYHAARTSPFDALIVDVMMPGMTGIDLTRGLRESGLEAPILLLTARDATADVIGGLDAGADDYLTKPFSFKVLLARLRAISRRSARAPIAELWVDDLSLDPGSRRVMRGAQPVSLTATEFRLLECLMRRAGRACSRSALIEAVWGFEEEVEPNTVDVFIKILRDKIDKGRDRKLIQTVRGYGYILREVE